MSTKFLSPGWRMPRNSNQSKSANYSLLDEFSGGIDLGTTMNITGNLSISGWFKPRGTTANNSVLVGKHFSSSVSPYFIFIARINSSGGVEWRIGTDTANPQKYYSVNSTTIVRDSNNYEGNWFHFTGTWDGVNIKIYINGVLEGTTAAYGNLDATTGLHTSIAALYLSAGSPLSSLNGASNNVSFFDYALSASQVTTLYGTGSAIGNPMALPSTPIAYYPLGTSAWDGNFLAENNAIGDYVFSFDGAIGGAFINCGNNSSLNITSALSVSGWFNTSATDTYRMLITKDSGGGTTRAWLLSMIGSDSGKLIFRVFETGASAGNSPSVTTTSGYNDGKWHFFTATYEPSTAIKIYVDNDAVVTNTTSIPSSIVSLPSQDVKIGTYGSYDGASGRRWDGQLSNIQILNTTLSPTDVETLYNYGSPIRTLASIPQSSNLKAWYKLDASEVYNSTSTEWEINNNIAVIKATALQNAPGYERLQAPNNTITNGATALSFSAWVYYPSSFGSNEYLRIFNAQQLLYVSNFQSNNLVFRNGAGFQATFNAQIIPGQWNHIAVSTESTSNLQWTSKLRLNGGAVETQTGAGASGITTSTYNNIDATAWGYVNYSGTVLTSNSIIWDNKALTDSELLDVYNAFSVSNGIPSVQPSSISSFPQSASISGWYKLDEAPFVDSSGNNNTLLASGSGPTSIGPGLVNGNGQSSGMTQANLVQSDLQTVAPYSKYAMNFDGTDDYISIDTNGSFSFGLMDTSVSSTVSLWANFNTLAQGSNVVLFEQRSGGSRYVIWFDDAANTINFYANALKQSQAINANQWYNILATLDGTNARFYVDGSEVGTASTYTPVNTNNILELGGNTTYSQYFNGKLSNASIWNINLTSAQVREIYNQGLPSNLNSHSAYSNLVSWWQLGENSSFTSSPNKWICADEKGTNNGESQNMNVDALTNGVGTTANGVSTSMAVGALVGDAPYSTANAISSGMAVTAKGTSVP